MAAKKPVWIGLVGLRPRKGNESLGDARGAFVLFLALASDETEYTIEMYAALEEFQFDFDEVCDVEPYLDFVSRKGLDVELAEIATNVSEDGYSRFGEFFVYSVDDA